jgi:hypothetical protein
MVVVTTTYEAELGLNLPTNMFKALGGIIFRAPMTVAVPAAFTTATTADLVQLDPLLWQRLGLLTKKDGVNFSRDQNTDTEESWGYAEPTRTDITQDVESAVFTLQETNRYSLELMDFVDLTAVTPDVTTGEFAYNKPLLTPVNYSRFIYMAVDGAGTDRRYRFKIMPRGQVVAVKDRSWQQTGSVDSFPITIKATVDSVLGYSVRNVLGGPGQKSRNTAAHFGQATP